MEVSFYLKRPKATEPTAIFARISYHGLQLKYYPSEKIHPKNWNKDTQQVRQTYTGYSNFNRRLKDIARDAEDLLREYQNSNNGAIPSPDELKQSIDLKLKDTTKESKQSLLNFFNELIEDSRSGKRIDVRNKRKISATTIKSYVTTYNVLKKYSDLQKKEIDFDNIDLDFYSDYNTYLQKTKLLSTNTIGKHIKIIKTALNEATEQGVNTNMAYKNKRFIKMQEESQSIYLSEKELLLINKLKLSDQPHLERTRDLFIVGCYTGLRFSDFSILKPENIKDGYIETIQKKTKQPVVIPIHDTVAKILKKYKGELPRAISNQKMNDYLKDVTKKIPELEISVPITFTKAGQKTTKDYQKCDLVTTHTARRSFATNEFKAGTPTLIIMAITGHKTEKAFMKYIKVTPKESAQILKLTWEKRKETKVAGRQKTKLIKLSA